MLKEHKYQFRRKIDSKIVTKFLRNIHLFLSAKAALLEEKN